MNHLSLALKFVFLLAACLILASCSRYSFRLNDYLFYSPPQIYLVGDEVTDVNLKNCIQQHIEDQEIHTPEELRQLSCSSAGINNLDGLERFSRIEQLDLENNQLTRISTLFMLANLQYVDLRNNPSISCEELNRLKNLVNDSSQFSLECVIESP